MGAAHGCGAGVPDRTRADRDPTNYTELNAELVRSTGLRGFDFASESERAALGQLLGRIVERELPNTGLMLSAQVLYSDGTDPGPGFYKLAEELGLLEPGASQQAKRDFWIHQVTALHEYYSGSA